LWDEENAGQVAALRGEDWLTDFFATDYAVFYHRGREDTRSFYFCFLS